ncbi:MerR family transcriptional regulator [mine drainage metagenome]|uniref:MerR family transcriptional regulator n=1 Tax=mine drainage metagenome TaxID=410659 RepID=T1ANB9_9ZZZZ
MTYRPLTIGRIARSAGVNIETIRYYQRRGLVREPPRPAVGYRHYPAETVTYICFIKHAQRLGFTLREIGELLKLNDGHCADVHSLVEGKCERIRAQVRDLKALSASLRRLADLCGSAPDGVAPEACPIIHALADGAEGGAERDEAVVRHTVRSTDPPRLPNTRLSRREVSAAALDSASGYRV